MTSQFDFVNILFAGPCNRACFFCIGKELPPAYNVNNLKTYPLPGIGALIERINTFKIRNIVFTGTISDPQLYRYQQELMSFLRREVGHEINISIHTNGALTLKQIDIFNQYDKSCISFPSFNRQTYQKIMQKSPPDLAAIVKASTIEVKVSCVLTQFNVAEIDKFLHELHQIGVPRVVLRNQFNDFNEYTVMHRHEPVRFYRNNPVYDLDGMEVTYWSFNSTESRSINFFPDGHINESYLLTDRKAG